MTPLELMRKKKKNKEESNLKEKNNLIKIHNDFIEGFITKNSITPVKILFYISRINNYSNDNLVEVSKKDKLTTYMIDTKLLCKYCNIDKSVLIKNIKKLQETSINLVNDIEELESISIIPRSKFIWGKNKLEVDIYNDLIDLIIEVEKKYTTIDFTNIMKIKNKHTFKLLQLLEQMGNFHKIKDGVRVELPKNKFYSIEELNLFFGTNYKNCFDIERRILKPSQEELDTTSKITFLYDSVFENIGRGRPKSVGFKIFCQDNSQRQGTLF